jgi:hypothetical protein
LRGWPRQPERNGRDASSSRVETYGNRTNNRSNIHELSPPDDPLRDPNVSA